MPAAVNSVFRRRETSSDVIRADTSWRNNEYCVVSCVTLASSVEAPRGPTSRHRASDKRQVAGFHAQHYADEKSVLPQRSGSESLRETALIPKRTEFRLRK